MIEPACDRAGRRHRAAVASRCMTPLLEVRDLRKDFPVGRGLRGRRARCARSTACSFDLAAGETLGIVGESGCGKTTLGRLVLRLIEPTAGTIRFAGDDLLALERRGAAPPAARDADHLPGPVRRRSNPRMRVGDIVGEGLDDARPGARRGERRARVAALLERVGLRADALRPLSARVQRRAAPAHRHRARAGARAAPDRRRRAGVGARRLDPGADRQPAAGPAGRARASPISSLRTTCGLWNISAIESRSCTWDASSSWPTAASCTPTRAIRTRARCCRPCPSSMPARGASASCCAARCRARSHPPAAAPSIRAARSPKPRCRSEGPALLGTRRPPGRVPRVSGVRRRRSRGDLETPTVDDCRHAPPPRAGARDARRAGRVPRAAAAAAGDARARTRR